MGIILAQIRDAAVVAWPTANQGIMELSETILRISREVIAGNNTSEEELQLRASVRVRIGRWVGSVRINSPLLPLREALSWRSRLLCAKEVSWHFFRSEWVALMQQKGMSLLEAASVADEAWRAASSRRHEFEVRQQRRSERAARLRCLESVREQRRRTRERRQKERQLEREHRDHLRARLRQAKAKRGKDALEHRLKKTLRLVMRALDLQDRLKAREAKAKAREEARIRSSAVARERKAHKARSRTLAERWRWQQRSDLTMEEIIAGPPPKMQR